MREVVIKKNRNSHVIKPLIKENYWIAVPLGVDSIGQDDSVETFSFYPASLGF